MLHRPIAVPADVSATDWDWTARRFAGAVLAIWAAIAVLLVGMREKAIAARLFVDPDDELRLNEVRDWLGGQSFWDVSQHRANQPVGGAMHWSRIVDAPLAAFDLLLRPLLGPIGAETASAVIVPMLTLATIMLTVAWIARRLGGVPAGLIAAAIAPTGLALAAQIQPMRVDHHGWEIAWSLVTLAGAIVASPRTGAVVAGIAAAIGLQISLEQLPFVVALAGVLGLRWILAADDTTGRRLVRFLAALAISEAMLVALLHGPANWGVAVCDAVSPPHLLALAIGTIGAAGCVAIAPSRIVVRGGLLAFVGGLAIAAFRAWPPHCGLDPFVSLEPIVKRLWLDQILEGLPVWRSAPVDAICAAGFPIVAIVSNLWLAGKAGGDLRTAWLTYGAMLAATTLTGIMVMRASALSTAIALVPTACLMLATLRRVQRSGSMLVRVGGSAGLLIVLSPWMPGVAAALVLDTRDLREKPAPTDCKTPAAYRTLSALPPSRFLAPVDYGPALLLNSPHSVLTTGHHRSHAAIATELVAMTGSDAVAERIIRARAIDYVLVCPRIGEFSVYRRAGPNGFASHLLKRRAPSWLARVPGTPLLLWKVLPGQTPAGSPSSRSAGGSVPQAAQISRNAVRSPSS